MFRGSFVTLVILSHVLSPLSARAEFGVEIACQKEQPKAGECSVGINPCEKLLPKIIEGVEKHFSKKMDCYYQGVDIDFDEAKDAEKCEGTKFPLPVCNLAEEEFDVNKRDGASCGEWARITKKGGALGAAFGKDIKVKVKFKGGHGTKESGWMRGAWLQALKCYKQQVVNEIESGKISIKSEANQEFGRDTIKAQQFVQATTNKISSSLCAEGITSGSFDQICDDKSSSSTEASAVKHRAAACYLRGATSMMNEGTYVQLATSEIYQRADKSFTAQFRTESAHKKIEREVKKEVLNQCKKIMNACEGFGGAYWAAGAGLSELFGDTSSFCKAGSAFKKMKKCYKRLYPKWLKKKIETIYPDNGGCEGAPVPDNTEEPDVEIDLEDPVPQGGAQ